MPGVQCDRNSWHIHSEFAQWKQPACLLRLKDFFDKLPNVQMQREASRYLYLHHYGGAGYEGARTGVPAFVCQRDSPSHSLQSALSQGPSRMCSIAARETAWLRTGVRGPRRVCRRAPDGAAQHRRAGAQPPAAAGRHVNRPRLAAQRLQPVAGLHAQAPILALHHRTDARSRRRTSRQVRGSSHRPCAGLACSRI